MKKIYISVLVMAALGIGSKSHAQAGSVTLTPTAGAPVAYASITAAYAAIPASPSTSYMIELLAPYTGASETYPIQLTDKGIIPGGANTITIRPAAGNNAETIQRVTSAAGVVLQFNGGDNIILDGRPGGITSTAANYLTINDPFVGSSTNRNIEILNAASSNTVQYVNCTAAGATAAVLGSRVILVGATTTTGNLNNTIQNCVVTGGLRGIQDFGQSDAIPNSGTKILNNQVLNFGSIGIFGGTGQSNITITGNTVTTNFNSLVVGSLVGIQQQSLVSGTSAITNNIVSLTSTSAVTSGITGIVDIAVGTENITGNQITTITAPAATFLVGIGAYSTGLTTYNLLNNSISNITGAAATSINGISLVSGATPAATTYNCRGNKVSQLFSTLAAVNIRGIEVFPPAGSTVNLFNSFVSITDANTTATFIFGVLLGNVLGNNYTANVYHNSIRIGGTGTGTAVTSIGLLKSDANVASVMNIKNNLVVTDRVASAAFNLDNTTGTLSIDYNNYFGLGIASSSFAALTTAFGYDNSGLAAYKAEVTPLEQNTTFNAATFASNTDLHLVGASINDVNLKGTTIAAVTVDIDGQARPVTLPTKGADENGAPVPVELMSFNGAIKNNYNQLTWTTASESNNAGFELQRSADGINFTALGFVASKALNGTSSTQLTYSFDDSKPFVSASFYRLKQLDKDGRSKYSVIVRLKGKEVAGLQIANVYPNPVANSFSLIVAAKATGSMSVAIIDMSGKIVSVKTVGIVAGDNIIPMDASKFAAGSYRIQVTEQTTGKQATIQFVK